MAKMDNGIFGGISGKVGDVVVVKWKNVEYVRSRPKVNDRKSPAQIKQRDKFLLTMSFLKTMTPVIRIGFEGCAKENQSAFNAAMSYNMNNAIVSGTDGVELNFSMVMVSKGPLLPADGIFVNVDKGKLKYNWNLNLKENANPDDQAMIVAYNSVKSEAVYDINAGKRSNLTAEIILPNGWKDDIVEAYIAFKKADNSIVSDSFYAGEHNYFR